MDECISMEIDGGSCLGRNKKSCMALLLLIFFVSKSAQAEIKNLIIWYEPVSEITASSVLKVIQYENFKNFVKLASKNRQFNNIAISIPGGKTANKRFLDFDLYGKKSKERSRLLRRMSSFKKVASAVSLYSTPAVLKRIGENVIKEGWSPEETLLVVFGDLDLVSRGNSSQGESLNAGWLYNERSPFVRKFLKHENKGFREMSVIVFNRITLDARNVKKRRLFIANLFNHKNVKAKVYGITPTYNNLLQAKMDETGYVYGLVKKMAEGRVEELKLPLMPSTTNCTYTGVTDLVQPKCGRNM